MYLKTALSLSFDTVQTMFDEVDSPLKPRRPSDQTSLRHKQKKPDIFQNELASKLKERKKLGLAADLTSEESDVDVEKSGKCKP